MLKVEKIRLMTQISIFEEKDGKDIYEISRHFKGDYISRKILVSMIHYTLCFLLAAFIMLLMNLENILLHLNLNFITSVSRSLLILYGIGGAICAILSYVIHAEKYEKGHRNSLFYAAKLDKLLHLQSNRTDALDIDEEDAEYYAETGGDIRIYNPQNGTMNRVPTQFKVEAKSKVPLSPKAPASFRSTPSRSVAHSSAGQHAYTRQTSVPKGGWLDDPIMPEAHPSDWIDDPIEPEGGWLDDAPASRSMPKHPSAGRKTTVDKKIDVLDITKR
jgi:hypothetical protein